MFERLINNTFPYELLMKQSRMNELFVPLFSKFYKEQKAEGGDIQSNTDVCFSPVPSIKTA